MKKFYLLALLFVGFQLAAQRQYLDPQYAVSYDPNVKYGTNIGVLTGAPMAEDLYMDVYYPSDDEASNRPVVLVAHTGSFLPPVINGQATGWRYDNDVVYLCQQLAARGYVAVAYEYRLGWNPVSSDQNVRTGTLLQAAYRGIQDTRACVRYMRQTADVGINPYGIDPEKIMVLGVGTGGYLALGAGTLYDFDEVTLDKFYDTNTATPYIDSLVMGNIYGDTQAAICLPNNPGYSSEISFAFNIGGACGDQSWIDGEPRESAIAGVHCTSDIFAPFSEGPVIVPTTNEFVVYVAGTRAAVQYANERGNNDVLNDLMAENDPLHDLIEAQKVDSVTLYTGQQMLLGTDNFYAFKTPFPQGSPWDWWDKPTLDAMVAGINAQLGTDYNSDEIHMSGLATNPDMSREKGIAYCDTILNLMLPRACYAMNLGCQFSGTDDIVDGSEIGLKVFPNPIVETAQISTEEDYKIESVYVYDINGRLVKAVSHLNTNNYTFERNNLSAGNYVLHLRTKEKSVVQKITIQ